MTKKKKCPICGKGYRDWLKHIWTHKKKTTKWLAKKRKASKGKKKKRSKTSNKSNRSLERKIDRILVLLDN